MKDIVYRMLLSLLILAGVFSACNEDTIDPIFFGAIQGTVTFQSTGLPVPGVEITTIPATSTVLTDASGNFTFPEIPTGEYTVIAQLEAYKPETLKVIVTENHTAQTDFQLLADASAPGAPTVAFPPNGAANIDRSVTLKWTVAKKNNAELTYIVVSFEFN